MRFHRSLVFVVTLAALVSSCAGSSPSAPSAVPSEETPPPSTSDPTEEPSASGEGAPTATAAGAFQIDPAASEARFLIDEILNGSPNTVIGATQEISGELQVNPDDPSVSVVGPISIDAGSLVTDNGFRNGAIRRFILQSGNFPVIAFASTSVEGLPAPVSAGETYTFTLTGDLTIRDITHPVTFQVTITVESNDRLSGSASATIQRSDFELTIPSVPQVAEVSSDVILEIDFTAVRVG